MLITSSAVTLLFASLAYTFKIDEYLQLRNDYVSEDRIAKREINNRSDSAQSGCVDLHENCRRWSSNGYCNDNEYIRFMKIKCRRSCHLCEDEQFLNEEEVCKDRKPENCKYWAGEGFCTSEFYQEYMNEYCRKSCKLCQTELVTTVTVPQSIESTNDRKQTSSFTTTTSVATTKEEKVRQKATSESVTTSELIVSTVPLLTESYTTTLKIPESTSSLTNAVTSPSDNHSFDFTTDIETTTEITQTNGENLETTTTTSKKVEKNKSTVGATSVWEFTTKPDPLISTTTSEEEILSSRIPSSTKPVEESTTINRVFTTEPTERETMTTKPTFTTKMFTEPGSSPSVALKLSTVSMTTPTSEIQNCQDFAQACEIVAFLCEWDQFTQTQCKKTCNLCSIDATVQLAHAVTEKTFFDRSTNHEASTKTINNFEQTSSVTTSSYDGTNPEYSTRYVEVPATTDSFLSSTSYQEPTTSSNLLEETITTNNLASTSQVFLQRTSQPHLITTQAYSNHSQTNVGSILYPLTSLSSLKSTTSMSHKKSVPDCEDQYEECTLVSMYCDINTNVSMNCKKTCGLCGEYINFSLQYTTTAVATTNSLSDLECKDTFSKCFELKSECQRPESIDFLRKTCRKTCGFCQVNEQIPAQTSAGEVCQDEEEVCASWSQSGFCDSAIYPQLKTFMIENCRKSCHACGENPWSTWSECSLTCGGGEQIRRKTICRNGICDDPITEIRFCAMDVCPKKPNQCEDRISTRSCLQYKNNNACGTEIIQALCTATCGLCENENDVHLEDITENWKPWSTWSHCNASCNGGVQTRNRTCAHDSCVGSETESIACNTFNCHSCYDSLPNCKVMERFGACRKMVWKLMCKATCAICQSAELEGRCADSNAKCSGLKSVCRKSSVTRACPVTCGKCIPSTEPSITTTPTVSDEPIDSCVDKHRACPEASSRGYCSDSRITNACPKSCDQCNKQLNNIEIDKEKLLNFDASECTDDWNFCSELEAGCRNSSFVQKHCRVTCNLCFVVQTKKKGYCLDQNTLCSSIARYGQCNNPTISSVCRLSCDPSCLPTTTSLLSSTMTSTSESLSCTDGHSNCGQYHALGRCDNTFIRFLCPRSCSSCEIDKERIDPPCADSFGQICKLMSSRCSESVVQYGCEKTCGACQDQTLICKDALERECQALGREGMCSMATFRQRCPVTCNSCKSKSTLVNLQPEGSIESVITSTDQCKDIFPNCNQLSSLCGIQTLQTVCQRTCNKCPENLQENSEDDVLLNSPCMDINPEQCRSLSAIGQCTSVPSVAFMCAKSCEKCRKKVRNCIDRSDTCPSSKKYCSLNAIQLQCPKTCDVCNKNDQEGINLWSQPIAASKSYYECLDHIDECPRYKSYCGIDRWLKYMDTMCPNTCGICGIGSWTKWSSWSECSKSCNDDPGPLNANSGGNRTRTRKCVDGRYCLGGKSASIEVGKCNKDRCPSLAKSANCADQPACKEWKRSGRCRARRFQAQMEVACPVACGYCVPALSWSSWSECSAKCGTGQQTRSLVCSQNSCRKMKNVNATEVRNCTEKICDGWAEWSPWSTCSSSCGVGSKMRIRSCLNKDLGNCPGKNSEESICGQNIKCPSWSSWTSWSDCSLSCGNGTKHRNRNCTNISENLTCDGSGDDSLSCYLGACPQWGQWGDWSNCSVPCGRVGVHNRTRTCSHPAGSCGNESLSREEKSCGPNICLTWNEWTSWSTCSVTCGSGGNQKRWRKCQKNENSDKQCKGSGSQTRECATKLKCIRWSEWSAFSECSATCGTGYANRTRICNPKILDGEEDAEECPGDAVEKVRCNCDPCPDIGVWSIWGGFTECSVTCNGGTKTKRRICFNGIPGRGGCQGPSHLLEKCGEKVCPVGKWNSWSVWSSCSTTCGLGRRSRNRFCSGGNAGLGGCQGKNTSVETCNDQSCPEWSQWNSWSTCSASCGSSGTRSRSKSCYDSNLGRSVPQSDCTDNNSTAEQEECNVQKCPSWGQWETWQECSASCGVGFMSRRRRCKNGKIGDVGCHFSHATEKQLCNVWDCPSKCRGVPLRSDWHSKDEVVLKDSIEDFVFDKDSIEDFIIDKDSFVNNSSLKCLKFNETGRIAQVSFKRPRTVAGIKMKGYQDNHSRKYSWVKRFLILYGDTQNSLTPILDNAGRPRMFDGPDGPIQTIERYWRPTTARLWRIKVLSSHPSRWVCMVSKLQRCRYSDELAYSTEGSGIA